MFVEIFHSSDGLLGEDWNDEDEDEDRDFVPGQHQYSDPDNETEEDEPGDDDSFQSFSVDREDAQEDTDDELEPHERHASRRAKALDKIKKLVGNEVKTHQTTWTVVDEVHTVRSTSDIDAPGAVLPNFHFGPNWQYLDLFLHLYPGEVRVDIDRANAYMAANNSGFPSGETITEREWLVFLGLIIGGALHMDKVDDCPSPVRFETKHSNDSDNDQTIIARHRT